MDKRNHRCLRSISSTSGWRYLHILFLVAGTADSAAEETFRLAKAIPYTQGRSQDGIFLLEESSGPGLALVIVHGADPR